MQKDQKEIKKTFLYLFSKYFLHISIKDYQQMQLTHPHTHRDTINASLSVCILPTFLALVSPNTYTPCRTKDTNQVEFNLISLVNLTLDCQVYQLL